MTFLNASISQNRQAAAHELTSKTFPTTMGMDGKMVDVPPSSIVTGQYNAYNFAFRYGNKAHPRITIKI